MIAILVGESRHLFFLKFVIFSLIKEILPRFIRNSTIKGCLGLHRIKYFFFVRIIFYLIGYTIIS